MWNENPHKAQHIPPEGKLPGAPQDGQLHPGWQAMIQFCRDMGYGEIACIKIHDGVPVSAEVVTKKIRWY